MIRILHTSDWHLGQLFHNYDRSDEISHFFEQLIRIIEGRRPDALLISGDIFDVGVPALEARRQWAYILEELTDRFPTLTIIATAGNHDSGSSLEVGARLLRSGIHIIGRREKIIKVNAADGSAAIVAAVPYISEGRYRGLCGDAEASEPMRTYYNNVNAQAHEMSESCSNAPVIVMAHLAVSASDFAGCEKHNFSFHNIRQLGEDYDYAALGHIHRPQMVGHNARYSGSPIPMNFDEEYAHSVTEVDFDEDNRNPQINVIEIMPFRPILTYPKSGEDPLEAADVEDFIKYFDNSQRLYLRIRYKAGPQFGAEIRRRIDLAFAGAETRLCELQPVVESQVAKSFSDNKHIDVQVSALRDSDPVELAIDYGLRVGQPLDEKQLELLKNILG